MMSIIILYLFYYWIKKNIMYMTHHPTLSKSLLTKYAYVISLGLIMFIAESAARWNTSCHEIKHKYIRHSQVYWWDVSLDPKNDQGGSQSRWTSQYKNNIVGYFLCLICNMTKSMSNATAADIRHKLCYISVVLHYILLDNVPHHRDEMMSPRFRYGWVEIVVIIVII